MGGQRKKESAVLQPGEDKSDGLKQADLWLERCWGKMPKRMQLLDERIVWMQVLSEKEVDEIIQKAKLMDIPSPFSALERWMEFLGPPPWPMWLVVRGVPLHAWHEEVFRLIGNCISRIVLVNGSTTSMEDLQDGRIKVLMDKTVSLPCSMPLWVEDLRFFIQIEEEAKASNSFSKHDGWKRYGCRRSSVKRCLRKEMMTSAACIRILKSPPKNFPTVKSPLKFLKLGLEIYNRFLKRDEPEDNFFAGGLQSEESLSCQLKDWAKLQAQC